jgi:hypothetical protein
MLHVLLRGACTFALASCRAETVAVHGHQDLALTGLHLAAW